GRPARRRPSASACSRPSSFSGGSAWPWNRPSRFQSVSPCRARRIVVTTPVTLAAVDLGLRDRVCVVTGSTGGIGLSTARLLAEEGARVVTSGRSPDRPGIGETLHVSCDLARPGEPERLVEAAVGELGGVDYLGNQGGL